MLPMLPVLPEGGYGVAVWVCTLLLVQTEAATPSPPCLHRRGANLNCDPIVALVLLPICDE